MKSKRKNNLPQGFSAFSWAIAIFCIPVLLWPVSLLLAPNLSNNTALTSEQLVFMNVFLWAYPFFLFLLARLFYLLYRSYAKLTKLLLTIAYITFYAILYYIFTVGFGY